MNDLDILNSAKELANIFENGLVYDPEGNIIGLVGKNFKYCSEIMGEVPPENRGSVYETFLKLVAERNIPLTHEQIASIAGQ